ncbi:MAG: helix-turn-helix domain-containing protein [Owenweeksia sp.]
MNNIAEYNFPEADSLAQEIRLVPLEQNFGYVTSQFHRHNYFELFYFTRPGGVHHIDFREHTIGAPSVHLVLPGSLHLVKRSQRSQGYVLLFTRSFLYSLVDFTPSRHLNLWQQQAVFELSKAENDFVGMCMAQIGDELKKEREGQYKVIASLLHTVLILLYRQAPELARAPLSLAERFSEKLELHFASGRSASDYAEELGCSLNHLNKALAQGRFPSAQASITERRVLEAKRLLIHTTWGVKEITYHLGYEDPDYFGKVFKKHTGQTVSEFVKNNRLV